MSTSELPIAALRASFLEALARGPVVVSSPTGSGKSTEIPRWCDGNVLVIEPRRVACRSLAARVADLEETSLGEEVGYVVRDDAIRSDATRILFATPGIALRDRRLVDASSVLILDEFHERGLDLDLLLALSVKRGRTGLVVMSATIDGPRIAEHIGGTYLCAEGRTFPVEIRYTEQGDNPPDSFHLVERVTKALTAARNDSGDVLVFLPGKAEIELCRRAIEASPYGADYSLVVLHGGLSLNEQRVAFESTRKRKVILATNVAETSITINGVGVVIDSGLVRQNRYHAGRASLVLGSIAEDSAAQRAGRAGRTTAGVCYRLWSHATRLAPTTLPEIYRESLVPLVMSAAAWEERPEDLPLLDAPKPYALQTARADLATWGALTGEHTFSEIGRDLFTLPIAPALARLVFEARKVGCLEDAVDLVAALEIGRPIFVGRRPNYPEDDLRSTGCDATALIRAVRIGLAESHGVSSYALEEARRLRTRLRKALGLGEAMLQDAPIAREALLRAAMTADARVAHVSRARGRKTMFSNGGTELELANESAVQSARDVVAIVVFDARAFGTGKETRLLVTCASAVPFAWLAKAGLGEDQLRAVRLESGQILASIERVYANEVIQTREEVPQGELARTAIVELFTRGSLFRGRDTLAVARERLRLHALAAALVSRGHPGGIATSAPLLDLKDWVTARVRELGVESGDDLALLSAKDFLPEELPSEARAAIETDFPRVVSVGDATYEADYDLTANQVTLRMIKGSRQEPPPLGYLPRFGGLRICVQGAKGSVFLGIKR